MIPLDYCQAPTSVAMCGRQGLDGGNTGRDAKTCRVVNAYRFSSGGAKRPILEQLRGIGPMTDESSAKSEGCGVLILSVA